MRKLFAVLASVLLAAFSAGAAQSVKDLDIKVSLIGDGSAIITEVWDVTVSEGTEWYLVRTNLGDIRISGLQVTDETGRQYIDEGEWDVNRSLTAKAGRCGLARRNGGYEICWGLGSHGHHVYTVTYVMSNVVKTLNDYDMMHMQLVSPGLGAPPQNVKVTLDAPVELSEGNSKIWGFGFYGDIAYEGGKVVAQSDRPFSTNSSVIELIRFDKGIFNSPSVQDKEFQTVLDSALKGSDFSKGYDDDEEDWKAVLLMFVAIFGGIVGLGALGVRQTRKNVLGVKKLKEIPWSREVPFGGNLMEAYWVLQKLGMVSLTKDNTFATAMVLKMIKNGQLATRKDRRGDVEITFAEGAKVDELSSIERTLFDMMKEASGSDVVLQSHEFSRWSKRHTKTVSRWVTKAVDDSWSDLVKDKFVAGLVKLNKDGQAEARKVVGFKQFLSDFTLSKERSTQEVILWQDYLIYAALFGIADKVAKELKDINPQAFEEAVGMDPVTYVRVMDMSSNLANSITNAQAAATAARAGSGGHTSFGGGGGFSGGGFGGGAR